jgi:hypothetical protein
MIWGNMQRKQHFEPIQTNTHSNHVARPQIFAYLANTIDQVQATLSTQIFCRRTLIVVKPSNPCAATQAIDAFIENVNTFTSRQRRGNQHLIKIASDIAPFRLESQSCMPTRWVKTPLKIEGMQLITLTDKKTLSKVKELCESKKIKPPTGFIKSNSVFYGRYRNSKLVTVIALCVANLNKTPGSIVVSVDLVVSTDDEHSATIAIDSIKKNLRKRKHKCVLYAQVAPNESARSFWNGKLNVTKRASVIAALLYKFDNRYTIYTDVDHMALFF